jgi:hypothetical protein
MTKKSTFLLLFGLPLIVGAAFIALNLRVRSMVDERMEEFVSAGFFQSLDYAAVWLMPDGEIIMRDLHVVDTENNEYVLKEIAVSEYDYINEFPHHLKLSVSGMHFPGGIPATNNLSTSAWHTYIESILDEDVLPISVAYGYDYSPDNKHYMENDFSIELPGSFVLTASSEIENISVLQLDSIGLGPGTSATQYSSSLQDSRILGAEITVQDTGLVPAMLAAQGEAVDLDPSEYRQQLMQQLEALAVFAPQQLQFVAQDLVLRIGELLEGEKTLRVSVSPEFKGNFQELQLEIMGAIYTANFERIFEVLNPKIEMY